MRDRTIAPSRKERGFIDDGNTLLRRSGARHEQRPEELREADFFYQPLEAGLVESVVLRSSDGMPPALD